MKAFAQWKLNLMTFPNINHFFSLSLSYYFHSLFRAMTSPSMKSIEKKTPEKKTPGTAEGEASQENAAEQQETPRSKIDLNNFAWFRVFSFAKSLCKSY